jgi:hypothetical protein
MRNAIGAGLRSCEASNRYASAAEGEQCDSYDVSGVTMHLDWYLC